MQNDSSSSPLPESQVQREQFVADENLHKKKESCQ